MAVRGGQPVGDLLDLLGIEREWPEVFDALVFELDGSDGDTFGGEAAREQRLAQVRQRMTGR